MARSLLYGLICQRKCKPSILVNKSRWGEGLKGDLKIKEKQDRQCRYNVTVRRVHETIVAVEKQ
jgi:hypothetical protein